MNFALLWIDILTVALLWAATGVAIAGRSTRAWDRNAILVVAFGIPACFLGAFFYGSAMAKFTTKMEPTWFGYALSLLVAYLAGASMIFLAGRRCQQGLPPAAANWGRAPLALGCLVAVAVGYMTLWNMDVAIRARCAIESVRVKALYLATLPAIASDSQNAATIYDKAFANLKADHGDDVKNPPLGNNEDFDPNEPATIAFLQRQAPTLALLRQAAALPACRFEQDLADPQLDVMLTGDLNFERHTAYVLRLDASEELARGHVSAAIADTAAIYGMSRHFAQRPMLVSGLVGIGIGALADKTLEDALPAVTNRDELAGLRLAQLPPMGRMLQQALRGEEEYGLALYGGELRDVVNAKPVSGNNPQAQLLAMGIFGRVFVLDSDDYMSMMNNYQNWATQPYYAIEKQAFDGGGRGHGVFVSILLPSMSRMLITCGMIEATDACAEVAVAMTRFRLDHGAMPARLDDLVPDYLDAVPTDPFDGKPIRLAVKPDRWIIYSVGPDGVDNGGVEMDKNRKGDVIFTLRAAGASAATKP
jgi:hypothetical protein